MSLSDQENAWNGKASASKQCRYCERTFTKAEHLQRHQRTHTGERPFQCVDCGTAYARSDVLMRHVKNHHQPTAGRRNNQLRARRITPSALSASLLQPSDGNIGAATVMTLPQLSPVQQPSTWDTQLGAASDQALPSLPNSGVRHTRIIHRPGASQSWDLDGVPHNVELLASNTYHDRQQASSLGGTTASTNRADDHIPDIDPASMPMSSPAVLKRKLAQAETSSEPGNHGLHFEAPQSQALSLSEHEQSHSSDWLDGSAFDFLERTDYSFGQPQFMPFDSWDDPSSLDLTYNPPSAVQTPGGPLVMTMPARSQSTVPDERYTKVARLWPITAQATRLSRSMWRDVARHGGSGRVSDRVQDARLSVVDDNVSQAYPEYSFDEASYQRVVREFGSLASMQPTEATLDSGAYRGRRSPVGSRNEIYTGPSAPTGIRFPSQKVLDVSVGLYFRRFHPLFPFIHEPTFRARDTPTSLLFSLCLIGLCYLGDDGAKRFVRTIAPDTVAKCFSEVISITSHSPGSASILASLGSSALLLCLATILSEFAHGEEVRVLYIETITIAQRLGLFTAARGDVLTELQDELGPDVDDEAYWRIWARIESAKRLVVCLIMCDAFYAHNFSVYPVIRPESMQYYLPSGTEAFEAATAKKWRNFVGTDKPLSSHLFTFERGAATIPLSLSPFAMHALLATIWVRQSELRQRCLTNKSTADDTGVLEACQLQPDDPDLKDLGVLLLQFYSTFESSIKTTNPNFLASWNNLCMSLTADHYLFEIAAGRAGPDKARFALEKIETWCQTPGARRACLHAAQTFAVMSRRRTSDGTTFHSEMALFASALVLGLFVSSSPVRSVQGNDASRSDDNEPFEMLDNVDWRALGAEGLPFTLTGEHTADVADTSESTECAARAFIRYGRCISFGGKIHLGGYDAARRIFLDYVGLLEDVGRWNVRRYCHILRLMSDMVLDSSSAEGS